MNTSTITAILIDKDESAKNTLLSYLERTPEIKVAGSFARPEEALGSPAFAKAEIIFLDIRMGQTAGKALLQQAMEQGKQLLVLADKNHAAEAFELSALDYLMKPIEAERFQTALRRILQWRDAKSGRACQNCEPTLDDQLFVRHGNKYIRLPMDEIHWIESEGDYSAIHTAQRRYIVHASLKQIELKLPQSFFLRVHRRYIVRLASIQEIEHDTLLLSGQQIIPVGKSFRPNLLQSLNVL
jgi:DNA-binding LytR/AlgR family response regulator